MTAISDPGRRLSISVAVFAALASAVGLFRPNVYHDNLLVTSGWRGSDLVTLIIAAPVLAVLSAARTRDSRVELVRYGMLDYMLYNYAFYLFGAAFNGLFLVYVALVALSAASLLLGLTRLDATSVAQRFDSETPVRPIATYLLLIAFGLTAVYVAQSLVFVFTGRLPAVVSATGHPTSIVFALDLILVVPVLALAGLLILRRRPWGYVLAVIGSVKGAAYMIALSVATLAAWRADALGDISQVTLWVGIGMTSAAASVVLLRHMARPSP